MRKRDRELGRIAKRFNRAIEYSRNGHVKLIDKAGRLPPVTAAASPSCPGAQRCGLDGSPVGPVREEHQRWARGEKS